MKKLSLIVAMAVVLTMGGVFAAWTYADTGLDAENTAGVTISLVEDTSSGAAASLTTSGSLSMMIDGGNNNTTVLSDKTGTVTIAYDAEDTSADEWDDVTVTVTITVGGDNTYNGDDVISIGSYTTDYVLNDGDSMTIGFSETNDLNLSNVITIASINLATKSDYDDFALTVNPEITITVSAA